MKGFSVQSRVKNKQFRRIQIIIWRRHNSELIKPKGLLIYNPKKTIICEAQAKKLNLFPELIKIGEQKSCSSEKERKVNALALRADEGRDYLR